MVHRSRTSSAVASTRASGTRRARPARCVGSTTRSVTARAIGSTTTRVTLPQSPSVQRTSAPIVTSSASAIRAPFLVALHLSVNRSPPEVQVSLIPCRPPCASPMIAAMATTRRADMFTADGKPSDDDPRENGPTLRDERVTLVESLRCQRLTLEMKCSGLDAEAMARRSVEPSTMSLLGLVRHLAEMERATFRVMMSGQDVPRLFCSGTDRDGDFDGAVPDPQVVAEAWDAWRAEADFATRFVAKAPSLDITGDDPLNQHGSGGGPMSLGEGLVGMIEEYARHMGHVDLLRERIDGRIGQ